MIAYVAVRQSQYCYIAYRTLGWNCLQVKPSFPTTAPIFCLSLTGLTPRAPDAAPRPAGSPRPQGDNQDDNEWVRRYSPFLRIFCFLVMIFFSPRWGTLRWNSTWIGETSYHWVLGCLDYWWAKSAYSHPNPRVYNSCFHKRRMFFFLAQTSLLPRWRSCTGCWQWWMLLLKLRQRPQRMSLQSHR